MTLAACVVIPSYNNGGTIAEVVTRALQVWREVWVVDDGSTDGTGEKAREAGAEVLVHSHNQGKGAALLTALREAQRRGFTHLVSLDGDAQHHPEDILPMLTVAQAHPGSLVVGSRPWRGPNVSRGARFGRWFSNFSVWLDSGARVDDSQSGFRVYPVGEVLDLPLRARHYDFEMEVLVRAAWAGIPIHGCPIRVYYPPPSQRVSHFDAFSDNLRISGVYARLFLLRPFAPLIARNALAPSSSEEDSSPRKWTGRSTGTVAGWMAAFFVLRMLGRRAIYLLLRPLSLWYLLFVPSARRASLDYLKRVLGPVSWLRSLHRSRLHLLAFGTSLADRFLLLAQGPRAFHLEVEGEGPLLAASREGRGVVLLTSHLGSAEIAGIALSLREKIPVKLVMFQDERPEIRRILEKQGVGMPEVIGVRPGALASLEILSALRAGNVVAMKGDRVVDGNSCRVPFLGAPAPFPTGPFWVAALARVPVFEVHCLKEDPLRYRVWIEGPFTLSMGRRGDREATVKAWVGEYAARLERYVKRDPYQWFNFYGFWEESEGEERGVTVGKKNLPTVETDS